MSKDEFFNNIEEIISDEIYLTESLEQIEKEIKLNCWSITIPSNTAKEIKVCELLDFFKRVIENRKMQLKESGKDLALLFYTWVDERAGSLRFNLINNKHKELPFGSEIKFIERLEHIIKLFLSCNYLDGIPFGELKKTDDIIAENSSMLKIYKQIITS